MAEITESPSIKDLLLVQLNRMSDSRGLFSEIFRKEWFPELDWDELQSNHSESRAGVLRGLHFHHHQVDYWYVMRGKIRAGLVDLRPSSPTYRTAITLDISQDMGRGILIPVGVAHGFYAVEDTTILYFVDKYYDGQDEYGVMWNDEDIGIDWGTTGPFLSERDRKNPGLNDLPESQLPR